MPRRVRLDPKLTTRPFSTAEAQAAGINRGRLESGDLDRPFRGVRSVGVHSRLASYVPRLREYDRFSHTSAAELWGAPLPPRLSDVVHVTATHGAARPRARGMTGHVSRSGTPVLRRELPVSDAATTFIELASLLNERELVAVGDHLVFNPRVLDPADWRPHATIEELRAAVEREPARGVRNARRALARVRSGVESPMETELRLLLEDAGLPRAESGYELRDANSRWIGWFDLAWPEFRVIAEYDGDQHRASTQQYDRDITRFDAAADIDWRVIRVRAAALHNRRQETVDRVRRSLRSAGWAPDGRKHS